MQLRGVEVIARLAAAAGALVAAGLPGASWPAQPAPPASSPIPPPVRPVATTVATSPEPVAGPAAGPSTASALGAVEGPAPRPAPVDWAAVARLAAAVDAQGGATRPRAVKARRTARSGRVAARGVSGDPLDCIRWHETNGTDVISARGKYRGIFQFARSTWDTAARWAGRLDLVGVDPARAAIDDQWQLARALVAHVGYSPWPQTRLRCGV